MKVWRWVRNRIDREGVEDAVRIAHEVMAQADAVQETWKETTATVRDETSEEIRIQSRIQSRIKTGGEFVIDDLFPRSVPWRPRHDRA